MKTNIFKFALITALFGLFACNEVLERPPLTTLEDEVFWVSEQNVRLFANDAYTYFFPGYNTGFSIDYTPVRGYNFSDDFATTNKQPLFETSIPTSRGSNSATAAWLMTYNGPTWSFYYVRKANLMLHRIETKMKNTLTTEQYNHWTGIARFYRALEYSRLVATFGDVPYFNQYLTENDTVEIYKDRTPREVVMDSVSADFEYAIANVRLSDGAMNINKHVVAAFASRWLLFEGTWQKYHKNNETLSKKFLDKAIAAANVVIASNAYACDRDFRTLFGSENLAGVKECIMYRHYSATQTITHAIASYSNCTESQATAPNLALVRAFICNDGRPWQNSTVLAADSFNIANLIKTRDPRFEATFWNTPRSQSATLLYACKFIDRAGATIGATPGAVIPPKYGSNTNNNGYPVMRYAEVLLNWIEAKAEVATLGGAAVVQADIDKSINVIRNRPLDSEAVARGVKRTAAMSLATLPTDPTRDADVPALIWEIRRERRMEFVFEHSRLLDIKRWKKLNYMDGATNPDILLGIWVNFPRELPSFLVASKVNKLKVRRADGTVLTYSGTNGAQMIGFYLPEGVANRDAFTNRAYVSPVGKAEIDLYTGRGKVLTQTVGW